MKWHSGYPRGFITWDDNVGLDSSNPKCYCGITSRQDRISVRGNLPGWGFWTCAAGQCDYFSERRDGIGYYEALDMGLFGGSFALGYFPGNQRC
jgi:hypothetical protein